MKKLKSPISIHYEIVEDCNHKCRHCYNYLRFNDDYPKQSVTKSDVISDAIIDAEIFHVVLTGGEPLLDKKNLFYIARKLRKNNIQLSLNTNLTLLNKSDTDTIKDIGFRSVLTSIVHYNPNIHDNQTQIPGSLERVLNAIDILVKKDVHVGVNMVVTKDKVNDVYDTGKFLAERGIKSFAATRVAPNYSDSKMLESLIDSKDVVSIFDQLLSIKDNFGISVASLNPTPLCFEGNKPEYDLLLRRGCAAGNTNATINHLGEMRACQHSYIHEGSIINEGVIAVWKRIPVWKTDYLPEICQDCSEGLSCGGGCRETARAIAGKLNSPDPLARGSKFVLRHSQPRTVNNKQKIRFANDTMSRREEDGGVLFRDPQSFVILSKEGYDLSKRLRNSLFSIEELSKFSNQPINAISRYINKLYSQDIVREA